MGSSTSRPAVAPPPSHDRTRHQPLHPEAVRFLQSVRRMPALQSADHGRTLLDAVQRESYHPLRLAPAVVTSAIIPINDDAIGRGSVAVHVVRSLAVDSDALLPAVVYAHGACGDFATHERFMRALADRTGAAIVFVDYDRAPWPSPSSQMFQVATWLAECGDRVGVDGTRLALAGDGIGAHIATAASALAADDQDMRPRMRAQILVCPVLDAPAGLPADDDRVTDLPWTSCQALARTWDEYAPDPTHSPLVAHASRLRLLPSTLVIVAERDVVASHGRAYADALTVAGGRVEMASYGDAFHDFCVLDALADTPPAAAALDLIAHFAINAFMN